MSDVIFIRGIEVETVVGIYEWERDVFQKLLIDVEISVGLYEAGQKDDIACTFNYQEIKEKIKKRIESGRYNLVERVAYEIAEFIHADYCPKQVRVKVSKPNALQGVSDVGVEVVL